MGNEPVPQGCGRFVTCKGVVSSWWLGVSKIVEWGRYNRWYGWEFKFVRVVGKPFHFWFDGQLSQDFSLVEVEEEGRDITIDWVETVVEDE